MLPTFVIGLREGLEAALIVGIVAAFLRQQGRSDLLKRALLGVLAAVIICLAGGVALQVWSASLPQRQQEALETIIGAVAVLTVTYMLGWMRRHSRDLRGQLEGSASEAIASGSASALVAMAFLAVLREGFETAVFLIAAFNETGSGASAGVGATLGIGIAVVLGYGIYRGGVRVNLSRFFRVTGLVLVLVASGLVMSALHTAHEAGWLNIGQQQVLDLSNFTRPGSIQSSLLTGMLGIQDRPTVIELLGWSTYLIVLAGFVAWPAGTTVSRRMTRRLSAAVAIAGAAGAAILGLSVPAMPESNQRPLPVAAQTFSLVRGSSPATTLLVLGPGVGSGPFAQAGSHTASGSGQEVHQGVLARRYRASSESSAPRPGQASVATLAEVAALNGGRLPLGTSVGGSSAIKLSYAVTTVLNWWVEPRTGLLIDVTWSESRSVSALLGSDSQATVLGSPASVTAGLPPSVSSSASAQAKGVLVVAHERAVRGRWAGVGGILAVGGAIVWLIARRRRPPARDAHSGNVAATGAVEAAAVHDMVGSKLG